ncbi:MAG: T9SS type A sorting domain-containing protein, partial [bacterium]|nr:T9SS type A sorting domain-containing protein [bacterium]
FYYNAFIDDDSLFGSVNEMGDIEDTLYQFSLLEGRYFWKVMAYDSFDNMGAWSQAWSFRYDTTGPSAPVLSNPPDDSYISGNSLAWHPATDNLTGISRYTVEIDNDSLFGSINVSEDSEETLYAFSLLEGVYYWRVMAYDSSENPGAWSSVWSFEYDGSMPIVPLPLSPVNDSALTDTLVNFWVMSSYKSSNEAKSGDDNVKYSPVHYIINVDTVRDLSSPIFIDTFDTEYGSGIFKDERRYYWSARAYDEAGNQGFESPADSFRIDYTYPSTPVLLSPSDSAITSASLFIWNSSTDNYSGVQYYELVYDDDSLFASPETLTTADTTQNPVLTDGRYYWRVRAVDNFDNTGEWASKQMFDYDNTPPSSPSLASPLDKTTSSSSTFVWHAASDNFTGVREYTLWYDDDSLFGSANTVSTADTFHTATLSDLVYYWRVSSSDNAYNVSSWSDVWSFDYSPAGISEKFIIDTKDKEETSIRVNLNGVRFTTISSESEFFVYDITGKIVYSAAKNKTGRHFYSTDNLSSGIYFVKLKDEEKEIKRKIVILR